MRFVTRHVQNVGRKLVPFPSRKPRTGLANTTDSGDDGDDGDDGYSSSVQLVDGILLPRGILSIHHFTEDTIWVSRFGKRRSQNCLQTKTSTLLVGSHFRRVVKNKG